MKAHKRGRPREVKNPVRVSVRISGPEYDRMDAMARSQGKSVPAFIRQELSLRLDAGRLVGMTIKE